VGPSRADVLVTLLLLSAALVGAGCSLTLASDAELSGGSRDSGPGAGSAYRSAVVNDGPVAYWRLDEATGAMTAHDQTGHGHDGTYSATCALGAAGALLNDSDPAVGFDGDTSSVDVTPPGPLDFPGNKPFSVEGWLKPARVGDKYHHALNHESQPGPGVVREGYAVFIEAPAGNLDFERFVANQGMTLRGPVTYVNQWYYVVGTYDTATLMFYVNGAMVGAQGDGRAGNALADGFYIGAGETQKFFNGTIDEVAIYDKALTQAQVTAHYRASGRQ
jgi:hypothetical protein